MSLTRRERFIEKALSWQGVPWRNVGSRREGANCVGLIVGVAGECDFPMSISSKAGEANYVRPPVSGHMLKRAREDMEMIDVKEAVPGDLLLFRIGNEPSHITILVQTDPIMILHSDTRAKKVRLTPILSGWVPLVAFKIRELDE